MLLTVREAASLLRTTERQVYSWVDDGELPFQRVRDQLRFNRTELLEWATARRLPISLESFDAGLEPEDRAPSLVLALRAGGVHRGVHARDREEALRAVVARASLPDSADPELVLEALVAREHATSTAVGDGVAIPHVRQPVVAPGAGATVSVFYLDPAVPFGAADGKPVEVLFFIVSPTVRAHLQLLARVARALQDPPFRAALDRRAPIDELTREAGRLEAGAPRGAVAAR